MFENYALLVFIDTGQYEADHYREYSKRMSSHYGLSFEEVHGSTALLAKMTNGPWDDDFVVVPPGQTISYEDSYESNIWKTSWLGKAEETSSM